MPAIKCIVSKSITALALFARRGTARNQSSRSKIHTPLASRPPRPRSRLQAWRAAGTAPPPGSSKCSVIGCPSDWTPGLPCQCNPDCERYGNCCADKEQVCGKAPPSPSPGPWPCRWPPCPGPPAPSCGHVAGKWSAAAAGDVVTITQSGCNLVATDPRQPWSPAQGTGQAWNLQMTFGGVSLSGHLQGCSPSGCPQGSTISFSNGQRWTRQ